MTATEAGERYEAATKAIRARLDRADSSYALAMSDACRDYETAMRDAARQGDAGAARACMSSVGPYLNARRTGRVSP